MPDKIITKPSTPKYREGWERIFKKKHKENMGQWWIEFFKRHNKQIINGEK